MTITLIVLIVANLLFFLGLLVWVLRGPAVSGSLRLRAMAWVLVGALAVLVIGSLLRLLIQFGRLGTISDSAVSDVVSYWDPIQSVLATAAGLVSLVAMKRYGWSFVSSDRFVTVLTDRVVAKTTNLEPGSLTARELDVLEVISAGKLSDEEIAADLSISASTAATHVRNILNKAGLGDRRDLMLLLPPESVG